jgi:hypothetical protein
MQTQVAMTKNPAMAQEGTTSGVSWNIEVHSIGDKPVTHWISGDFTCPGDFLLVSQKPANSPSMVGGGGLLGSLVSMAYKQILGLYGFLPSDAPGYDSAVPVPSGDTLFDRNFATMTSSLSFGKSLLNPWTITPFDHWAEKYPLKTVNANDQVGQLACSIHPGVSRWPYLACSLPMNSTKSSRWGSNWSKHRVEENQPVTFFCFFLINLSKM